MKIKRVPTRKLPPPPEDVQNFANRLAKADEGQIVEMVSSICSDSYRAILTCWPFGKSDLFYWIPVLDRFDGLLESAVLGLWKDDYQVSDLAPENKLLVVRVLEFSRLLLENCSSRNIYASYDRLHPLLRTTDLDVFEKTLELLMLPARKVDGQTSLRNIFETQIGDRELAVLADISPQSTHGTASLEELRVFHNRRWTGWLAGASSAQTLYVKLLSLAIFLLVVPEPRLSLHIFANTPTIITNTARLLSVNPEPPMKTEVAAISLLRGSLRMSAKWSEIIYALNLAAGHGPVASIIRTIVDCIVSGTEIPYSSLFMSAFLDFVYALACNPETDETLVVAGVLNDIVRAISSSDTRYLRILERLLVILDTLNHRLISGTDSFFAADGLHLVVKQITGIVDSCLVRLLESPERPPLPSLVSSLESLYFNALLKVIDRLLSTNTGDDRLRNLVEGSIFKSIKAIFENQSSFGPDAMTFAVSIMSNFIHNEPTSLGILQEQGVPQAFVVAIKAYIPPSTELISKLPPAFSAVCLNSAGASFFAENDPVPSICAIFMNAEYAKSLRSHACASALGSGMDEFMRHNPAFKPVILKDIINALSSFPKFMSDNLDSPLDDGKRSLVNNSLLIGPVSPQPEDEKPSESIISTMLDLFCMFIEGVLQSSAHIKDFVDADGLNRLFDIYTTPGLPFDFSLSPESFSIAHLFRVLNDSDPVALLSSALKHLTGVSPVLESFLEVKLIDASFFNPFLDPTIESVDAANSVFRSLCSVLAILGLLCDLYVSQSFPSSRVAATIIKGLASKEGEAAVILLAIIFRAVIWEYNKLLFVAPRPWLASIIRKGLEGKAIVTDDSLVIDHRVKNLSAILFVLQKVSVCIMAIFGGVAKMVSGKRTTDVSKEDLLHASSMLANCAAHTLEWLARNGLSHPSIQVANVSFSAAMVLCGVIFFDEPHNKLNIQPLPLSVFVSINGLQDIKTCFYYVLDSYSKIDRDNDALEKWRDAMEAFLLFFARITNMQCYKAASWEDIKMTESDVFCELIDFIAGISIQLMSLDLERLGELGPDVLRLLVSLVTNLLKAPLTNKPGEHEYQTLFNQLSDSAVDRKYKMVAEFKQGALLNFQSFVENVLSVQPSLIYDVSVFITRIIGDKDNQNDVSYVDWLVQGENSRLSISVRLQVLATLADSHIKTIIFKDILPFIPIVFEHFVSSIKSADDSCLISSCLLIAQLAALAMAPANSTALEYGDIIKSTTNSLLDCLSIQDLSVNAIHAIFYLVVAVTRTREYMPLDPTLLKGILQRVLRLSVKCLDSDDTRHRSVISLAAIIMRHYVEAPEYLGILMEYDVTTRFKSLNTTHLYVDEFIESSNDSVILRDWKVFMEMMKRAFTLEPKSFAYDDSDQEITLQSFVEQKIKRKEEEAQKDSPSEERQSRVTESLRDMSLSPLAELVVNTLLEEFLLSSSFPAMDSLESLKKAEQDEQTANATFYRYLIILFLKELLSSYPVCHAAFVKSNQCLTFLITLFDKVVSCGDPSLPIFSTGRLVCDNFITFVCIGSQLGEFSEAMNKLADNCRIVVDAITAVLKEQPASASSTFHRMTRLYCLNVSIKNMLNTKTGANSRLATSVQLAIAAQMIERKYVSLLTVLLAGLDKSYQKETSTITSVIIENLEHLCQLGNLLSTQGNVLTAVPTSSSSYIMDMDSEEFGYMDDGVHDESDDDDDDDDDMSGEDYEDLMDVDESGSSESDYTDDEEMYYSYDESGSESSEQESNGSHIHIVIRPPFQGARNEEQEYNFEVRPNAVMEIPSTDRNLQLPRSRRTRPLFPDSSAPYEIMIEEFDDNNDDEFNDEEEHDQDHFSDSEGGYYDDDEEDDDEPGQQEEQPPGDLGRFAAFIRGSRRTAAAMGGRGSFEPHRRTVIRGGAAGQLSDIFFSGTSLPAESSYSAQIRAPSEVYSHPFLQRPAGVAAAGSSKTSDISLLTRTGPKPTSYSITADQRKSMTFFGNRDIFNSTVNIPTSRRWQQEAKLLFGDLVMTLAESTSDEIIAILKPDAQEFWKKLQTLEPKEVVTEKETTPQGTASSSFVSPFMDLDEEYGSETEEEEEESNNEPNQVFVDTGPDPSFLEALPFDMRAEVLNQYFEERRTRIPERATVQIDPDFLARLSQDLREDYTRLSELEIQRHSRRESRGNYFTHISFSDFLGSMDPSLRNALLSEEDNEESRDRMNDLLQNGRGSIRALNGLFRDISASVQRLSNQHRASARTSEQAVIGSDEAKTKESVPFVDSTSLSIIMESYYDPYIADKRTYYRLFQHLCCNGRSRADILNLLLFILEKSSADNSTVHDLLETYLSMKGCASGKEESPRLLSRQQTPKPTPRKRPMVAKNSDNLGSANIVILQWTLQLLIHLVTNNEQARSFFTASCESSWTIIRVDRKAEKKNDGNKTFSVATKFPIVVLLANLENQQILQTGLLAELVLHLLSLVSHPIKDLVSGAKEEAHGESDEKKKMSPIEESKPKTPSTLEIPPYFLFLLVKTLTTCELTPKAFNHAMHVFQNFSYIENAANSLLNELSDNALKISEQVGRDLARLGNVVNSGDQKELADVTKAMSLPLASQKRLYRLLKMTNTIMFQATKPEDDRQTDKLTELSGIQWERQRTNLRKDAWNCLLRGLPECLVKIGDEPERLHLGMGLLPAFECYFLHCRQLVALSPDESGAIEERIFHFAEAHRKFLNALIRNNNSLLTTGSLSILIKLPRALDFDNKRGWFVQQLHKRPSNREHNFSSIQLNVRRAYVFEDSFHQIMSRSGDEVKYGRIHVKFHGEEGIDAGGVTREWFDVLSRRMFNPDYALFKTSVVDKITYQPNRASFINPDHLQFFAFVGRIIGKAIFDNRLLDCYFTRSFYKHVLGIPVDMKDLEATDPDFYKGLLWILENDITDVVDLTFSLEADEFGVNKVVDLKPGGSEIAVNQENKREYVRLVTEYKLTTAIKPQIEAFLRGFHEIIPENLIAIFNEQELELLISGMPEIDIDDWRNNTEYQGFTSTSAQIQWFWRALRSFDHEQRTKLVQFVTGTSKVPLEGFAHLQGSSGVQKFQIHRDYGSKDRLPSAHTCFNQLDLPEYDSYEQLRDMLVKSITEAATGFGFA